MEKDEKSLDSWRLKGALLSLGMGCLIMGLKFLAYRLTHSAAILSDALESIVNVVAALFAVFALRFATAPPDREHPYGHGKMEFITAIFEGGLIAFAALVILYEALVSFFGSARPLDLGFGLWISLLAGILNALLGITLLKIAKATESLALEADGKHVLSDFYTSIGLLAGMVLVKLTALYWLDAVIAMLLGIVLLATSIPLIRKAISGLLDEEDPKLLGNLLDAFEKKRAPAIIRIHHVRAMRNGRRIHVDGHVVIPQFLPMDETHDIVERFENDVVKAAFLEGEMELHLDPCRKLFCRECEVEACPIRLQPFSARPPLTLDEMVNPTDRTDQTP